MVNSGNPAGSVRNCVVRVGKSGLHGPGYVMMVGILWITLGGVFGLRMQEFTPPPAFSACHAPHCDAREQHSDHTHDDQAHRHSQGFSHVRADTTQSTGYPDSPFRCIQQVRQSVAQSLCAGSFRSVAYSYICEQSRHRGPL